MVLRNFGKELKLHVPKHMTLGPILEESPMPPAERGAIDMELDAGLHVVE